MTTTPSTGGPSDSVVQDFANMSAALTGFQSNFLRPFLDPTNLSEVFYNFAVAQVGQTAMDNLLDAFRAIQKEPAQKIADSLLEVAKPTGQESTQAQIAQSIVLMWYLGSWYIPAYKTAKKQPGEVLQVISSQAYTKSLCWNVAQSHPMGFSAFTFGYWSQPPGSLDTFGVNTGGGQ
jgi:hypothetical protein